MAAKYYAILTNLGAAKLANATALGTTLKITTMAVGDGGGTLPTPDAARMALVNEVRRAPVNSVFIDTANANQVIVEQVIPESEGGFWIREIGLFDESGVMIAVANCAETYKPQLQEGSGRTQVVRMVLIVNSAAAVELKVDPSVVLATRAYVDAAVIEVKAYSDKLLTEHLAEENPHSQYLQIANCLDEIAKGGDAAIEKTLSNLRLGEMARMKRYLVSNGGSDNSWYEIYSDGFIRQGLKYNAANPLNIPTPSSGISVNYPIAFSRVVRNVALMINAATDNSLEFAGYTSENLTTIRVLAQGISNGSNVSSSYLSKFIGYIVIEGF